MFFISVAACAAALGSFEEMVDCCGAGDDGEVGFPLGMLWPIGDGAERFGGAVVGTPLVAATVCQRQRTAQTEGRKTERISSRR